jgi:hypothetical protein
LLCWCCCTLHIDDDDETKKISSREEKMMNDDIMVHMVVTYFAQTYEVLVMMMTNHAVGNEPLVGDNHNCNKKYE